MVRLCRYLLFVAIIWVASETTAQVLPVQTQLAAGTASELPDAPSARTPETAPSDTAPLGVQRGPQRNKDVGRLPTGMTTHLTLLSNIGSRSPSGSSFLGLVKTSVAVEGKPLLPEGSIVEGHLQTTPARRMMRPGALRMIFDRIKLPDGTIQRARFDLVGAESDSVKVDDEGVTHPTVSKKRLALQLGGTLAIAKLADDIAEEALAAGAFLAIQKGREVKLREGDVIEVEFVRTGLP